MIVLVVPSGKFVALDPTVTAIIVAAPPGTSVPLVGEMLNQLALLASLHVSVLPPEFVKVKNAGFGVNGPPTGPAGDSIFGLIPKLSGRSCASRRPLVVELPGDFALNPMPRFAKAIHNS